MWFLLYLSGSKLPHPEERSEIKSSRMKFILRDLRRRHD